MERRDGKRWLKRLIDQKPIVTDGEKKLMKGTEEDWLANQAQMDAIRQIQSEKLTGDVEMVEIGRAKTRFLLGKETLNDEELFSN